jgi:NAD(P)-dependent dehydrogenase (short-subunit alcohol dehydrogenase family)
MKLDATKTAIVTGGASGLGGATSEMLAGHGVHVAVFDMNAEAGEAMAARIGGSFHKVDVSSPDSVAEGMAAVKAARGGLHIVVNCAGIGLAGKTVSKGVAHDPALFIRTININLIGTFNCASQGAALMSANDPEAPDGERGLIVNTASVAAFDGQIGQIAYSASKGGVVGMTLPMARDLAQTGIRVMTIAPGLFLTPMLKGLPQEVQDSLGQQVPFPSRLGDPAEYARLVESITANPMLNGEVIRLDGAIRMAPR